MGSNNNKTTFFRQLREDTVIWVFLAIFIVLHVPYFLPGVTNENLEVYSLVLAAGFFLPFTAVILWPSRPHGLHGEEDFFWKGLSLAFVLWWSAGLIYLFWPAESWAPMLDIVTDSIFLSFYISWIVALSFMPHVQNKQDLNHPDRWLLSVAASVLALCLFSYFVLIPSRMTPELYDSWVPSLLFFTGLDCVLLVLLVRLTFKAKTHRWKMLYSILAVTFIAFAVLDLLEAMNYAARFEWALNAASETWWNLPYLLLFVVARARYFEFPKPAIDANKSVREIDTSLANFSPIILMSFVLPVLYIGQDQLGLLWDEMRHLQSTIVLVSLAMFWVLAIVESRSLRRITRKAEAQTAELEILRVKQKVADQAEQVKRQFLANVSHEIRTPMNGILGMSEILLRGELSTAQRENARLVRLSAEGMLGVVDDILEYSKFEAGEFSLVRKPFSLDEIVTQVLDLFRATEKLKDVEIYSEFQDDVPLDLEGDSRRLRQVLMNLIANAVKFTSEGEIWVRFSLVSMSGSTARILCEVSDSGIGIEPGAADDLFLPFSQADESTSRKYSGSGLGLAISKQIVEAQSGSIGVRSNTEEGSVFWFEIAFKVIQANSEQPTGEPEIAPIQKSGKRILLAEDDVVSRLVAVKQLESLGLEVDVASNGYEVLKALDQRSYALILMDCQMPTLDGLQTTRLIREQGYSQSVLPIIALTANVSSGDRKRCFEAGMNDFIAKPVALERLRSILVKWL